MPSDRLDFKTRVLAEILIAGFNAVCKTILSVQGYAAREPELKLKDVLAEVSDDAE